MLKKVFSLVMIILLLLAFSTIVLGASKISLAVISATADDGNVPANVLDGNLSTRFASKGDGAYIILGASSNFTLETVKIAWNNGDSRECYFEIFASTDNVSYTKVYPASGNASSSGSTTSLETYNVTDMTAKYIKVVGHENSYNTWFSPTEIEVWGTTGTSSPTPTASIIPTPTATPSVTPTATPTPTATVLPSPSTSTPVGVNLALGKTVTYSSQQTGNEATRVVDGSISTRWSADTYPEWVCVDLGAVYSINRTEVAPYSNRSYKYKVEVSTTSSTSGFTQVVDRTNNTTSGSVLADSFSNVNARYVRLTVTGCGNYTGTWASITEFRVFGGGGTPSASPSPTITPSVSPSPTITPSVSPSASPSVPPGSPSPVPSEGPTPAPIRSINVSNATELKNALSNIQPGDHIILANGAYNIGKVTITKGGTAQNPVVIKAANRGLAEITGNDSMFTVKQVNYIVFEGLLFTSTPTVKDSGAIRLDGASYCRITRNTFKLKTYSSSTISKWVFLIKTLTGPSADYNRIDHNRFESKGDKGNFITIDGDRTVTPNVAVKYTRIDHNYFLNNGPRAENEKEGIRIGWSGQSMSSSFTTVEYNLLENIDGDPEYISVKDCDNIIRYNTIVSSAGVLCLRHGHRTKIYGNFFLGKNKSGTGGLRIYGNDHQVYNNYFEGLTGEGYDGTLVLDTGDFDGGTNGNNYSSGDLNKHWRVYRAKVVNNTLVNNNYNIQIGANYNYAPVDCTIANNIVKGASNKLVYVSTSPVNMKYEGNIMYPTGSATLGITATQSQIWVTDPKLQTEAGLQKLSNTSPAINYAKGSYPEVTEDMDGQIRTTNDTGADEYSSSPIVNRPLTSSDVGPASL